MEWNDGIEAPAHLYWSLWWFLSFYWIKHLLRVIWILLNQFYVIPAHFVYLLMLSPIYCVSKDAFWRIEETFFGWLLTMVACWSYTAGYTLVESGDNFDDLRQETILFMPNHQSTADVPFCMYLFTGRTGYADRVMWIMDKIFKFTNFGVVAWMHDDFFILAGKDKREQSLVRLRSHLQSEFILKKRKCLVLFPEGGFLRKRKATSNSFAAKQGLPSLDYVTLPRTGALEVIMDVLAKKEVKPSNGNETPSFRNGGNHRDRSKIGPSPGGNDDRMTKVVDVTIAYPTKGKPLSLVDIVLGWTPPCETHIHYRVFDISELPSDSEELKRWMYDLYIEKEAILEEFYRTGRFPHKI